MTDKLKMAELTSQEAREHLTEDAVILLPMGSLEDQGVHAPMGDYLAAEAVALKMARAAQAQGVPTFVAPAIPFGGKDYFDSSHGGISIRLSTLIALIDDMVDGLVRHGLRKILILNGHAGNVPAITEVTVRWRQQEDVFIPSMYLWQIAYQLLPQILGAETAKKSSGHGGDPLTSMGLHLYPEILRPDLMCRPATEGRVKGMQIGGYAAIQYDGVKIQAPVEAAETAPDGIWMGDPRLSSAETGEALTTRLVDIGVGLIRDHIAPGFPEKSK
jgi:creatinine amidohydrolase